MQEKLEKSILTKLYAAFLFIMNIYSIRPKISHLLAILGQFHTILPVKWKMWNFWSCTYQTSVDLRASYFNSVDRAFFAGLLNLRKILEMELNVSFILFFVFGFWSLLATKLRKYKNITVKSRVLTRLVYMHTQNDNFLIRSPSWI